MHGGTGLGLAITKQLVNLMGGQITVTSKKDTGSEFTIILPGIAVKKSSAEPGIIPSVDPHLVSFLPATIFIVDDSDDNRAFIRDALTGKGLTLMESGDGLSALEMLKLTRPALVITDIRMPGMSGFELLERIRADESLKGMPVIAYSASVMKEQKENILTSDFDGLLIKPVSVSDLFIVLMNYLEYETIERENQPVALNELSADYISDLPGLLELLEGSLAENYRAFSVRQPIGEIQLFGKKLQEAGEIHNCSLISKYGSDLVSAAESFDIETILNLLKLYNQNLRLLKNLKISE
jgi:CheY-like chemotaxis protein